MKSVLAGRRVLLADTAGLRETADPIEAEGVRRARAWAESADLRLWLTAADGGQAVSVAPPSVGVRDLHLLSKADLAAGAAAGALPVSTLAPGGLDALRAALEARVVADTAGETPVVVTRARHRATLGTALEEVDRALLVAAHTPELAAESVRLAGRALAQLTGEVETEAVLDRVFGAFCIGK